MQADVITTNPPNNGRILAAELLGSALLMVGGLGTLVLAGSPSLLEVALGWGLTLGVLVYVIGPISGCHVNPAVTLGMLLARRVSAVHAVFAWVGQLVGSVLGAAIVYGIASGQKHYARGEFGSNLWTRPGVAGFGLGATIVAEIVFTAVLVMVYLLVARRRSFTIRGAGAGVVGATLAFAALAIDRVDGTSLNPFRSLGAALFADTKTDALEQLWAFLVFPLIGAVLGVFLWLLLDDARLEDTALVDVPGLEDVRDRIEIGTGEAVHSVEDAID